MLTLSDALNPVEKRDAVVGHFNASDLVLLKALSSFVASFDQALHPPHSAAVMAIASMS